MSHSDKSFSETKLTKSLNEKKSINEANYRKKPSTTSKINISSHSSCRMKCENGRDRNFLCPYIWFGTMIIRRCQKDEEKLCKSMINGKTHEPQTLYAGNFAMNENRKNVILLIFSLTLFI